MPAAPAPPTLRALLGRADFALRLVVDDPGRLDAPLRGVHSSDLADPTPFLSDDLLLLTTGRQFAGWSDDDPGYADYVARLDRRGIAGIGFGTEVLRAGIPAGLAAACTTARMPLVEVPYETPFIALSRANAEAIAARTYARRTWALDAQRALALAALEPEGITATLAELARQLGGWAALFDASGSVVNEVPAGALDRPSRAAVSARAGDLVRRGGPGAAALQATAATAGGVLAVTVQTLGRGGHLRGALAVAAPALDDAARGVLTSAVGMLGLALEQRHTLARTQRRLRTGLITALLAGQRDLVAQVAGAVWGELPEGDVVVGLVTGTPAQLARAADALERHPGPVFFGPHGTDLVVVAPAGDDGALAALAPDPGLRVGASRPTVDGFAAALDQARTAAASAREDGPMVTFDEVADLAVLGGAPASRALAAARLAPLTAHDAAHDTALIETLRAWFAADCANEQTATALGVHRHTVRTRLAHIERLLDRDLGSFAVRADLWTALRLA